MCIISTPEFPLLLFRTRISPKIGHSVLLDVVYLFFFTTTRQPALRCINFALYNMSSSSSSVVVVVVVMITSVAKYCDDVCVSVCLSARISSEPHARSLSNFFVLVAYVRGSVLLRHVDDRPRRLSAGKGWRECTARAKCNLRLPCLLLLLTVYIGFRQGLTQWRYKGIYTHPQNCHNWTSQVMQNMLLI